MKKKGKAKAIPKDQNPIEYYNYIQESNINYIFYNKYNHRYRIMGRKYKGFGNTRRTTLYQSKKRFFIIFF